MVWATARNAPIRAYLEFDAHPDQRMAWTARLDVARINKAPRFMLTNEWGMGIGIHMDRARIRARVGAVMNRRVEEVDGRSGSLMNNFSASAIGWRIP